MTYTNEFLLRHAETSAELFLKSPEEYRFLIELKRIVNATSVINDNDEVPMGFAFGNHKILFQDGEIKLIQDGRMITQCKVSQFIRRPYEYFRKLYEMGHPGVSLYMGLYAENGFLEEPDYEAAVRYYEQGIGEGDEYCPVNLGRMYCTGTGVPVNLKKGFELYVLGWERGDVLAATNIGYCYEVGQGVRKNREKAIEYYTTAAEMGEEHAIEALKRLEEEE